MEVLCYRLSFAFCLLALCGCVSDLTQTEEVMQFEGGKERISEPVAVQQSNQLLTYQYENKAHKLEWFLCQPKTESKQNLRYFMLINRDEAGFNEQGFCRGWIAQVFLTNGLGVVGVNRPGFGKSTGKSDLGGEHSRQAIHALLRHTLKLPYQGIWAVNSGTILASLISRQTDRFASVILGNGIYDVELAHQDTKDPKLKENIDQLVAAEGEEAYEKRSIAWDFDGLPKQVFLYHGDANEQISISQASEFRQSLAAVEFQAELLIINQQGASLPDQVHLGVLDQILQRISPGR